MIELCEVGPRDGLQNEKKHLTVEDRVELIRRLQHAGLKKIEAVSFVNPKVVPQMAHAEEVLEAIPRMADVRYAGLVLSPGGMERALRCNLDDIHLVLSASRAFNLKNVRKTTDESMELLLPLVDFAKQSGRKVTLTIGNAFGCPYEGDIPFTKVLRITEKFAARGVNQVTLADTTGRANPRQVKENVEAFWKAFPKMKLGLHFHNTRGLGLVNVYAGYQAGVRSFDSSIGGLGGCPFAPTAAGNVCTEDMVHLFQQIGEETSANLELLIETAKWIEKKVNRRLDGLVMKAGPANTVVKSE